MLILTLATTAFGQGTTQRFQYVIPKFNSIKGSELILSNLSSKAATPQVLFLDATQRLVDTIITISAGSQLRFTAASFGIGSFSGPVVVNSSNPLSVQATIADAVGGFETVPSAINSDNLIVPFVAETAGNTEVTLFNPRSSETGVLISAVASNGTTVGSVQRFIPAVGSISQAVSALVPPVTSGLSRDISHVVVRTLSNVLGGDRSVYAQAAITNFSADAEGSIGPHFDAGVVTAVPVSLGAQRTTIPFFVQGGDYVAIVQVINLSSEGGSVRLTAIGQDGSVIEGASTAVVQIPANGSVRRGLQNIFNFAAGVQLGSIAVESSVPTITTAALVSVSQNGFVLMPTGEAANTNFVYRTRAADPLFYTGLVFRNSNAFAATLTVLNFPDDQSGISAESFAIAPFATAVRTLLDVLPEARTPGFIYVSSDVPIAAQAIEARTDNAVLANLPPMHSQPDFVLPAPTKFLITGTIRHNGSGLAGITVQSTGPTNVSTVTDEVGNYQFTNAPPGQYTIRPAATGYTFSPASIAVTVIAASRRDNNFAATLVTPTITLVQPPAVLTGSTATNIIVAGGPFIATSEILFESTPLPTTLTTASVPVTVVGATGGITVVLQTQTVLQATIPAEKLAVPRDTTIFVRNSGPGGSVTSSPQPFAVGSPAPTIALLNGVPNPLLNGNPGFTLTVLGTGFTPGTTVQVQGVPIATTFVSDTQLRAFVPPELLVDGGTIKITALKPSPTIGPSNEMTVTIFNPIPGVTSISPNSAEVRLDPNSLPMQLTVRGFGFKRDALVLIEGAEVPTEFRSSTELAASVPQKQLESAKIVLVSVRNAPPVLGTSEALPLSLYNLVPTVTSLDASPLFFDPTPRFKDDKPKFPAQVIIRGTNFTKEGLIYVYGTPCDTDAGGFSGERISSTMIVGKVNIACTGSYRLGVVNPQPGGGLSQVLSYTVSLFAAPAPVTVAGLAPAAITAGADSFPMTISGSNFVAGVVVNFGTAVLFPTSVTTNTIVVTVPSYLVRSSGIVPVSVTNPNLTGNSNRILFTIN